MHEKELRSNLAKELGRRSIANDVWEILQTDPALVADAGEDRESFERLAKMAKAILGFRVKGVQDDDQADQSTDAHRAAALGAFLAAEVAADERVQSFRQEVLGGGLLSADELKAMVLSPAAQMFQKWQFRERGIFAGRHKARLVRQWVTEEEDDLFPAVPLSTFHAEVEVDGQRWPTFERRITGLARYNTGDERGDVKCEMIIGEFFCWRASVLDDLNRLAEDLARTNGFWTVPETATFIVAAYVPPISAIEASIQSGSGPDNTITLKVRPYVTPASVAAAYRQLQGGFGLRPRRPLSERNLRIARFVFDQRNLQSGKHLTTRRLMDLWNEWRPEEAYESNRIFWRDFKSAEHVIEAERIGFVGGWRFRPERIKEGS